MYIGEIEKANNYLKMVVCQAYTEIGLGNSPQMEDFIKQINFIENRVYFQKRRRELNIANGVQVESHDNQSPKAEETISTAQSHLDYYSRKSFDNSLSQKRPPRKKSVTWAEKDDVAPSCDDSRESKEDLQ